MKPLARLKNACCSVLGEAHLLGDDVKSASRRGIFISSLAYNAVFNILNGTYLTGFLLAIGADANEVNTAVALMSLCNLLQLIAPLVLERLERHKPLLIFLRALAHGINLALAPLLVVAGVRREILLPLVMALITVAQCLLAFVSPGMQAWHIRSIPDNTQLGYFSFFTVVNCVTVYVVLFFARILTDALKAGVGHYALPVLRLVMMLFAAADVFFLTKVHEFPAKREPSQDILAFFSGMLCCMRKSPAYCKIIASACLWSFGANLPSQYYNAYLIDDLHLSYTYINLVGLFNVAAVIFFTPLWKKVIQKRGLRNGLFLSVLLYAPYSVGLAVIGRSQLWFYPVPAIYSMLFNVGITLCYSIAPYTNLPEEHKTMYLALYNAGCALSTLLGVLAGRGIFMLAQSLGPFVVAGEDIAPARILVIIYGAALFAIAFLLRRLLKGCDESQA